MATLFAVGIQTLALVVITALSLLMPSLARRDILFGATVAPNTREAAEGRAIIRRYRLGVLLLATIQAGGLAAVWALAPARFWASVGSFWRCYPIFPIYWRGAHHGGCRWRGHLSRRLSRRQDCVHGAMATMCR
jgi:hypothetical protein